MRTGYYFGAGISVESVPSAFKLSQRIDHLASVMPVKYNLIEDADKLSKIIKDKTGLELYKEMIADWKEISRECRGTPVDTFAIEKKKNPEILTKIKAVLSSYFIIEQSIDNNIGLKEYTYKISPRIRNFIAQLTKSIGNSLQLFNNPIIITWNYDHQIELSVARHIADDYGEHSFRRATTLLNTIPNHNFDQQKEILFEKTHVFIKLNGTAGYALPKHTLVGDPIDSAKVLISNDPHPFLYEAVKHFSLIKYDAKNYIPSIKFSFENEGIINDQKDLIKEACEKIERLVIMGYSFPNDNSQVDSEMIGMMTSLAEVHIFDLDERKDQILSRFMSRLDGRGNIGPKFHSNVDEIPIF
ncbi:hypothetical protein A0128_20400 [Leptospira tipperaryensis]|uniref:SIR2-like domain-containing protein n=1 Tax=Leptospira tipperaryensis TaxID=2564040 RepID=A0A1D7V3I1_9LEPT|nr:hypothetical protein [Leptospira tipperaryensis]AOP36380.1 hypothetical protein A0128_20400 [Leptospira tipperaryensis]